MQCTHSMAEAKTEAPQEQQPKIGSSSNTRGDDDDDDDEAAAVSCWILGGGLAGLATAAAIRRHCSPPSAVRVTAVLEVLDESSFHDETAGASTMLGPNGLRALRSIGGANLVDKVLQEGHAVTHIGIVLPSAAGNNNDNSNDNSSNQDVMLMADHSARDTHDHLPQVIVRWGRLRRFLQEELLYNHHDDDGIHSLGTVQVRTGVGADVCGYTLVGANNEDEDENENDDNSNRQQYVFPANSEGQPVRIDSGDDDDGDDNQNSAATATPPPSFLVVADGIHSPFQSIVRMGDRRLLRGPDAASIRQSNVQDNGRVNVKAVVRVRLDYDRYRFRDAATTQQSGSRSGGPRPLPAGTALAYNAPDGSVSCFAGSASRDGSYTYWAVSVADQVDERGSVLQFFAEDAPPPSSNNSNNDKNSNNKNDNSQHDTAQLRKDKLLQLLEPQRPACQFAVDLIAATMPSAIFVERSRQLTVVGPSFVTPDRRVVLVGDAAHAMSPSYGQGGNFGFEDAATLAQCLRERLVLHRSNSGNFNRSHSSSSTAADDDDSAAAIGAALEAYSGLRVDRCEEMFRRSAERVAKQARGENTVEDVQQWISGWEPPHGS